MKINRKVLIIAPVIIALLLILIPMEQLSLYQRIVVGGLIVVIFWWATGAVNRTIASLSLLSIFLVFGNTPAQDIFYFPLSKSFILVVCSLLLAEGITKSQIALHISKSLLNRWVTSSSRLVAMSFVLGIVLIFVIPHPYPRVIILTVIFKALLKQYQVSEKHTQIFLFSIFVAGTCTPILFLNGDFVLSYAMFSFAQLQLTWSEWAMYLTIPGLVTCGMLYLLFLWVFKKELNEVSFSKNVGIEVKEVDNSKRKVAYLIIITVMILWITEFLHGISSAYIALIGVIAMIAVGLLSPNDFKKVKFNLLLNLTAVFAIGKVLKASGITNVIQQLLITYLPSGSIVQVLMLIILIVLTVHVLLGSCLTSMSVTIPILIAMFEGQVSPLVIAMMAFIIVSIHYLLPYHHLTLVLGSGENYFKNKHIIRFGLPMTILIFIIIFLVYIPWWRFTGLI